MIAAADFAAASAAGVSLSAASSFDRRDHGRIACRDRGGEEEPVFGLRAQRFVRRHRRQVEPDVLGEIRNAFFKASIDMSPHATLRVSPPTSRLQGHSSSVCKASSTRSVSFGAAADIEVGGVDVLDHVVGIDDEGVAIGDAIRRAHAEAVDQRALAVGELPDRQVMQILVVAAPGQLAELVVGRAAEHDGVAVGEILRQIARTRRSRSGRRR